MENAITSIDIKDSIDIIDEKSHKRLVPFKSLIGTEQPLKALPDDLMENEFTYPKRFEGRCTICKSPYRDLAELVYIRLNKSLYGVVKFFEDYYNAHMTWISVKTHMNAHCDFSKIMIEGLGRLFSTQDQHLLWTGRENQLAITILMDQIDDVSSLEINRSNSAAILERAKVLRDLAIKLNDLCKARDEAILSMRNFNAFKILADLLYEIKDPQAKEAIRNKLYQIKVQLEGPNTERNKSIAGK